MEEDVVGVHETEEEEGETSKVKEDVVDVHESEEEEGEKSEVKEDVVDDDAAVFLLMKRLREC